MKTAIKVLAISMAVAASSLAFAQQNAPQTASECPQYGGPAAYGPGPGYYGGRPYYNNGWGDGSGYGRGDGYGSGYGRGNGNARGNGRARGNFGFNMGGDMSGDGDGWGQWQRQWLGQQPLQRRQRLQRLVIATHLPRQVPDRRERRPLGASVESPRFFPDHWETHNGSTNDRTRDADVPRRNQGNQALVLEDFGAVRGARRAVPPRAGRLRPQPGLVQADRWQGRRRDRRHLPVDGSVRRRRGQHGQGPHGVRQWRCQWRPGRLSPDHRQEPGRHGCPG